MIFIDKEKIKDTNFSGQGGKEKEYAKILGESWDRVSEKLFDFHNRKTNQRLEMKKQKNIQWLDPTKYTCLSDEEKGIPMHWVCYDSSGQVDLILQSTTQQMVEAMRWDDEYLSSVQSFYKPARRTQIKEPIKVRDHKESFEVIYER
jgi:hypothetical protein